MALLGGGLNAVMISRLGFPPLIVTLGTYSLFRGAAEGLTRGIENYSGLPPAVSLPRAGLRRRVDAQPSSSSSWAATLGLRLVASPHRPRAQPLRDRLLGRGGPLRGPARRAALGLLYALSGLLAGLAAVVYVAHLGQAKADAGTGFELMAITAVVLGGASIFGGRGTVLGTVLGLFAIVVLQNGLRLSGAPAELAGILTGTLLVATILLDRLSRGVAAARASQGHRTLEEDEVKNSQVVALSAVILGSALLVVGGNWVSVRSLRQDLRALGRQPGATGETVRGRAERSLSSP